MRRGFWRRVVHSIQLGKYADCRDDAETASKTMSLSLEVRFVRLDEP
jgi:hypothetical protein